MRDPRWHCMTATPGLLMTAKAHSYRRHRHFIRLKVHRPWHAETYMQNLSKETWQICLKKRDASKRKTAVKQKRTKNISCTDHRYTNAKEYLVYRHTKLGCEHPCKWHAGGKIRWVKYIQSRPTISIHVHTFAHIDWYVQAACRYASPLLGILADLEVWVSNTGMFSVLHVCMYVCMYLCMYVCMRVFTCVNWYIGRVQSLNNTQMRVKCIHVWVCMYVYTYIHACTKETPFEKFPDSVRWKAAVAMPFLCVCTHDAYYECIHTWE